MRIPVRPRPIRPFDWEEKKGPKCIYAGNIRGAALSGRETVDFLLFDRTRLRAELSEALFERGKKVTVGGVTAAVIRR